MNELLIVCGLAFAWLLYYGSRWVRAAGIDPNIYDPKD